MNRLSVPFQDLMPWPQDEVTSSSALMEVSCAAESQGHAAEARKAVFSDETGSTWQLLATACLREVHIC